MFLSYWKWTLKSILKLIFPVILYLFLQNNNKLIKEVFIDYLITFCRDDKEEPNNVCPSFYLIRKELSTSYTIPWVIGISLFEISSWIPCHLYTINSKMIRLRVYLDMFRILLHLGIFLFSQTLRNSLPTSNMCFPFKYYISSYF